MSTLARLRRRVPVVDEMVRALGRTAVIKALMRWSTVRDPLRFTAAELIGPKGRVQVHRIQEGRVVLRHRTRDIDIFDEVFVGIRAYDPPAAVATRLRERPPARVLDLGGNVGLFAVDALARWPAATVTSVEPDPENVSLLARCVEINGAGARWNVIVAFAASRPGTVAFSGGRFADSGIALDGDTVTDQVVAVDAFELLAEADFVKIDIEGSEWDLLLDERFSTAGPAVVVMEWHQRACPRPDARDAALELLRKAGYDVEAEPTPAGQEYGTVWAWRPAQPQMSSGT